MKTRIGSETKMSESGDRPGFARLSRRRLLAAGSALAGGSLLPMPMISPARAQDAPLKFWQFYAPGGAVPGQVQWFQDMVKAWNDAEDVKIELEFVPGAQYVSGTKLQTAFAAGEGPDLFLISPGDFLRYYNGGALLDLAPYVAAEARADFYDTVIATRLVDQGLYGLPMEVEPMAIYYSVKAFQEAGIGEADIPKSWDQLLELAKRLTTDRRFGILFETNPGYYQNFTWYPFLWQGGGEIVGPDGKSGFNSDAARAALKFWQDAVQQGVAPRKPLGTGGGDIAANLVSGFCAMNNVGIWGIAALRNADPSFEYGVFKLPLPPGGTDRTIAGGWAFVANAQGRNPDAAGRFCAWAVGSMSADSIQRGVDWCTKAKSDMPPRKSVLAQAMAGDGYQSGAMKIFAEQIFPDARGEPRVPPQVHKVISDAIQACQLNGEDPARQAELAARQIDSFLAGYGGAPII